MTDVGDTGYGEGKKNEKRSEKGRRNERESDEPKESKIKGQRSKFVCHDLC